MSHGQTWEMAKPGSFLQAMSITGQMHRGAGGTYVLALWLDRFQRLSIGRLGDIGFPAGWYLYVGSALGPGGLKSRLMRHRRHLGKDKRAHWHVDYLREHAIWGGVWGSASELKLECSWADALRGLPGAEIVAPGFGASDCRCSAHLVRVSALPDDDWFARSLGAERIAMGNEELDELLRTLATGGDKAREAASFAIGRFGAVAIGPLTDMLDSSDANVRWWAARALAEVGDDGAVPPLVTTLTDPDPDVRACAALALGRIGDGNAAPALALRLGEESAFVAGIAADALAMIGEPAVEALAEILLDQDPHARLLAVKALGRIRSQRAISPLFSVLEDPSYLVRYYAQEGLEALGVGMIVLSRA